MDCQFLFHWPTKIIYISRGLFLITQKNETLDDSWNWNITRKFVAMNDPVIWVFQYSFVSILKRKCLVGASRVHCRESGTPSTIIYTQWSSRRYELGCDAPVVHTESCPTWHSIPKQKNVIYVKKHYTRQDIMVGRCGAIDCWKWVTNQTGYGTVSWGMIMMHQQKLLQHPCYSANSVILPQIVLSNHWKSLISLGEAPRSNFYAMATSHLVWKFQQYIWCPCSMLWHQLSLSLCTYCENSLNQRWCYTGARAILSRLPAWWFVGLPPD